MSDCEAKKYYDPIIDFIPYDHYITRKELENCTGNSDRENRRRLSKLTMASTETIVISSSKHNGYKRPTSYEEVEQTIRESRSRIKKELAKIAQLERLLASKDQNGLGLIV